VYGHARKNVWRVRVTVSPIGSPVVGNDHAMAWFSAGQVFDAECVSAMLTDTGNIGPNDHVIGWIQVHRGVVIWLGWQGDNNLWIDWDLVECVGKHLYGTDQRGTRWSIAFNIWYAGYAPAWPDWLED
jgi:hypothetical protein